MQNPDSAFPIVIKPYKFDISQYGEKTVKKREFIIKNVSDEDIEISLVDMPEGMFKLKLPKKIKAGKSEKGKIEINDNLLDQEFAKSITIELNNSGNTRFTIPVKRTLRIPGAKANKNTASKPTTKKSGAK